MKRRRTSKNGSSRPVAEGSDARIRARHTAYTLALYAYEDGDSPGAFLASFEPSRALAPDDLEHIVAMVWGVPAVRRVG